ncbi:hypothetical protein JHJ32_21460 [Parapedobacter sp. ISTM3]|uniref:hypothetical protein n=1 Tax=Parapedobacter sp. ISTM3 TaxID=2800130 RepID=UPI001904139C|nr:hypothetical protein [Parapedobacter sp. ISTM3]MBK1442582.1 hypothetical protein [Parapedobacter sp. ISTM3]
MTISTKAGLRAAAIIGLIWAVALSLVLKLSAGETKQSPELRQETWYFDPQPGSNDPNLPQNYSRNQPDGVTCGGLDGTICSIQDTADPMNNDQPNLTHGSVTADTDDDYNKTFRLE